jgi:broad specificity phosphatase PhoE
MKPAGGTPAGSAIVPGAAGLEPIGPGSAGRPGGAVPMVFSHPLVVIRHGETEWNVARRLQGHEDIPLNDRGRAQARRHGVALRARCRRLGVEPGALAFVGSPLSRAAETMRIVRAQLGLGADGYVADTRLVELGFGRWAGLTIQEVEASDPAGHAAREGDRWNVRPPGGESMADGAARIAPLLAALDRPTVLVTHGGIIRILHVLLGATPLDAAHHLPTPQDRFLVLHEGRVEWV